MEIYTIGIDIGKTVFNLVGLSVQGEVVVRKKFSRKQLLHFTANLRVGLIGMEACGGSHFLGRALREQGHEVRLIPAQYVKPFVKTNKNDYIDAEAIAEAVGRPRMRLCLSRPTSSRHAVSASGTRRLGNGWLTVDGFHELKVVRRNHKQCNRRLFWIHDASSLSALNANVVALEQFIPVTGKSRIESSAARQPSTHLRFPQKFDWTDLVTFIAILGIGWSERRGLSAAMWKPAVPGRGRVCHEVNL